MLCISFDWEILPAEMDQQPKYVLVMIAIADAENHNWETLAVCGLISHLVFAHNWHAISEENYLAEHYIIVVVSNIAYLRRLIHN